MFLEILRFVEGVAAVVIFVILELDEGGFNVILHFAKDVAKICSLVKCIVFNIILHFAVCNSCFKVFLPLSTIFLIFYLLVLSTVYTL